MNKSVLFIAECAIAVATQSKSRGKKVLKVICCTYDLQIGFGGLACRSPFLARSVLDVVETKIKVGKRREL